MLSDRLRSARKGKGFSLRRLAERAGVSPPALLKYENNQVVQPNSTLLLKLAKILNVQPDYFFRPTRVDLSKPFFRSNTTLQQKQVDRILFYAKEWLEKYLELEELLTQDKVLFRIPEGLDCTLSKIEDVERIATDLRLAWKLGTGPINNLTELIEDKGIKIAVIDDVAGFDACFMWANSNIPVFLCKEAVSGDRQRLSLGHELAHLILSFPESIQSPKVQEMAAYRFAGAFLVPEETIYKEIGRRRRSLHIMELEILKEKYGLSMQAWIYRARDLHVITHSAAGHLFQQFSAKGWRREEPGKYYPVERSRRIQQFAAQALIEQRISEEKFSEVLGIDLKHFFASRSKEGGNGKI